MISNLIRMLAILGLALLLGGCATFNGTADKGRSLKEVKRFFVVSNTNDNHALDQQIATAFKTRGRTAEVGPLTMLPDDAQAVVAYQDQWAWDFGEHLVFLKITVRDPLASQSYDSATYSARFPGKETVPGIVGQLVTRLLYQTGATGPADQRPDSPEATQPTGRKRTR